MILESILNFPSISMFKEINVANILGQLTNYSKVKIWSTKVEFQTYLLFHSLAFFHLALLAISILNDLLDVLQCEALRGEKYKLFSDNDTKCSSIVISACLIYFSLCGKPPNHTHPFSHYLCKYQQLWWKHLNTYLKWPAYLFYFLPCSIWLLVT